MADNGKPLGETVDLVPRIDEARIAAAASDRERRKRVEAQYGGLFASVAALFFAVDPIGINFESNSDEYEPEVGTVLPRLESAASVDDVERILGEEFQTWFGDVFDGQNTDPLAPKLWSLWQAWKSTQG